MENRFVLEFDKMITKLAGNPLGKEIYNQQLSKTINFNQQIVIVFPERVDTIASSFIQGFFEEILTKLGVRGMDEMVQIESSIPNLKEKILNNLI